VDIQYSGDYLKKLLDIWKTIVYNIDIEGKDPKGEKENEGI